MNIVYLGKYTLNKVHASAGTKRVLNQIRYLAIDNRVNVITISHYSSDYECNLNLKRHDSNLLRLLTIPIHWVFVCFWLVANKQPGRNILLLESVVELNFAIPVLFSKLVGYKLVHDVIENFFLPETETSFISRMNKVVSLLFYRIITSYADGIIVISERLFEQYSLLRLPVLKLYNSVEIRQLAVDLEEKNETTTFLYSGTFGIKDAVQDLLRAFIRVSQDYTNVKLVLTGRNESDYFQECMELIQTNERICYLGYLDSDLLEKAYRNADVLVATRNSSQFADYGFPYKLSEYLSFGKPVIASAVSDIPMLFTDYEDILLVEPSNIESIAKKMKFAIDNRHILKGIAEKGFDKCNRYFSINRIGKDLSDFLTTI